MNPDAELLDIVSNGLILSIYDAEEALGLSWSVGQHAKQINDATFGSFFGSVQRICGKYAYVAVGRLLERPKERYKIRSIPAALKLLGEHAATLTIHDSESLKKTLAQRGYSKECLDKLSGEQLTRLLVEEWNGQLPVDGKPEVNKLSEAWDAIKTVRDKRVAHDEIAEKTDSTYAQIDLLLDFAKDFVDVVGRTYLQTAYRRNDSKYFLSDDAEMASRSMKRLLKRAGVPAEKDPCSS